MATTQVNIHDAKTHLSKLINALDDGDEVIIANRGAPVARLVRFTQPEGRRPLGSLADDEPLDESLFETLGPLVLDSEFDELGWPR